MVLKLYGWLQQNTLRMMILMKHHTKRLVPHVRLTKYELHVIINTHY